VSIGGDGHGSDIHFRRLLNQHHYFFSERLEHVTGAQSIDWENKRSPEGEWKNLGFFARKLGRSKDVEGIPANQRKSAHLGCCWAYLY